LNDAGSSFSTAPKKLSDFYPDRFDDIEFFLKQ